MATCVWFLWLLSALFNGSTAIEFPDLSLEEFISGRIKDVVEEYPVPDNGRSESWDWISIHSEYHQSKASHFTYRNKRNIKWDCRNTNTSNKLRRNNNKHSD